MKYIPSETRTSCQDGCVNPSVHYLTTFNFFFKLFSTYAAIRKFLLSFFFLRTTYRIRITSPSVPRIRQRTNKYKTKWKKIHLFNKSIYIHTSIINERNRTREKNEMNWTTSFTPVVNNFSSSYYIDISPTTIFKMFSLLQIYEYTLLVIL